MFDGHGTTCCMPLGPHLAIATACGFQLINVRTVKNVQAMLETVRISDDRAFDQQNGSRPIRVLVQMGQPDRLIAGKTDRRTAMSQKSGGIIGPEPS